jgi:hypothetical protein
LIDECSLKHHQQSVEWILSQGCDYDARYPERYQYIEDRYQAYFGPPWEILMTNHS